MKPIVYDGDMVVVNTADRVERNGEVFAINNVGEPVIKRLSRLPGGGLRIQSDNYRRYPPIEVPTSEMDHVRIIGRVVHVAGEGGL